MRHLNIFMLPLLFSLCSSIVLHAQYQDYETGVYVSTNGDSLLYRRLEPETLVTGKKYPLVLFLHGAGERGSDNLSQLLHGGMMFTNPVNREKFPAYVLFPQCPQNEYWPTPLRPESFKQGEPFPFDSEISKPLGLVKELLDKTIAEYPIDTERIYIMGLSMGGMGTFDMVCRYPDLFAAAIPICGGVNVKRLETFSSPTRFRIYHGDADSVVPVEFSRSAYQTLKKRGIDVEYIEYPGVDHGSWNPAFNSPDFLTWLFSQHKQKPGL